MSADDFCDILMHGKEEKEKDRLFFRWCLLEVHNMGEPVTWYKYLESMRPKPQKSVKQIIKDTNEIINQFNRGFRKVEL